MQFIDADAYPYYCGIIRLFLSLSTKIRVSAARTAKVGSPKARKLRSRVAGVEPKQSNPLQ